MIGSRRAKFAWLTLVVCAVVFVYSISDDFWGSFEEWVPVAYTEDESLLLNASFPFFFNRSDDDATNCTACVAATFEPQPANLSFCPETPPGLSGTVTVWRDGPSLERLNALYPDLGPGGHGTPLSCKARHRVAIVIPFRDREDQLRVLLHNLHSFLRKQQLDYGIFVVDQIANQTFNRAKLMNVGYKEALKVYDWQCFIFHDVDLLPEDDRNIYSCPEQPRHMSVAIDKFKYKLPYASLFGGISAMTRAHMEKINGFSNDYWGWGGEDDDVSTRVTVNGFKIMRYPVEIARYKMIKHTKEISNPVNECRYTLMRRTRFRFRRDGLSNLNYDVLAIDENHLFTRIKVDLLEAVSRERLHAEGRVLRKC